MADISKITVPNVGSSGSTTYDIKDATAREQIAAITGGYTKFLGVTTTPLEDGDDTNPITINGESVTAGNGDIVTYGNKEFIFNGTVWQELSDLSALGELAFADTASGTFTPLGSITTATFTGGSTTSTGKFTPSGSITGTSFTGASMTSTGNFTPSGNVSVTTSTPASGDTPTYKPSGSVSGSFTGASMTSTGTFSTSGTCSQGSPTTTTVTVKSVVSTDIATAVTGFKDTADSASVTPVYIAGVSNETLTLSPVTVKTQAAVTTEDKTPLATITVPAPTFSISNAPVSVTGTTTGSLTGLGFTGDDVMINGSFSGTQGSVSVTGTTTGSVSDGTFTGTEDDVSVTGTSAGSISVAWSGSSTSVTVSPDEPPTP